MEVLVTRKGQVTVPVKLRRKYKIVEGMKLTVEDSPSGIVFKVIPKIEDLSTKMNLPLIDVYNAFGDHSDYFVDGIHPNSKGATLVANEVYEAITPRSLR